MLSFPITDKKYIFLCSLTLKILAYVSLPQYLWVLIYAGPLGQEGSVELPFFLVLL